MSSRRDTDSGTVERTAPSVGTSEFLGFLGGVKARGRPDPSEEPEEPEEPLSVAESCLDYIPAAKRSGG